MSDNKKKKADEIVDEVAAEMGVENEKVPESDESADDVMAGLGGIFDVPTKKKKKKKKAEKEAVEEVEEEAAEEEAEEEAVEEEAAAEEEAEEEAAAEEAEEEAEEEKAAAKSKKKEAAAKADKKEKAAAKSDKKEKTRKKAAGIDGVFDPASDNTAAPAADSYLDEDDLGDFSPSEGSMKPYLIGIGVVLAVSVGAIFAVGGPADLMALFRGEYRERKIAQAEQEEEKHREEQLAGMNKFGNLLVSGYPQYAQIKLDGDVPYGQTSSGEWRALRMGSSTMLQGLDAREPHTIEITNPGFEAKKVELKPGMWQENPSGGDSQYQIDGSLTPKSVEAKQEFEARLASDVDSDYFGKITINTIPSGAKVFFNNQPLLDEKGTELRTPVTFEKNYVRDEESGKLEEKPARVDTVIDVGHKIQLQMPEEAGEYPKHVMALQRQMWTCQEKPESELKGYNPEKDSPQERCNYVFTYDFSFDALKAYIEKREAEMKAVEEHNKKERGAAGEEGDEAAEDEKAAE